jgi:hypothetical protein
MIMMTDREKERMLLLLYLVVCVMTLYIGQMIIQFSVYVFLLYT